MENMNTNTPAVIIGRAFFFFYLRLQLDGVNVWSYSNKYKHKIQQSYSTNLLSDSVHWRFFLVFNSSSFAWIFVFFIFQPIWLVGCVFFFFTWIIVFFFVFSPLFLQKYKTLNLITLFSSATHETNRQTIICTFKNFMLVYFFLPFFFTLCLNVERKEKTNAFKPIILFDWP